MTAILASNFEALNNPLTLKLTKIAEVTWQKNYFPFSKNNKDDVTVSIGEKRG